jgi:hypothetical protein
MLERAANRGPCVAVVAVHAHLDQPVCRQRPVGFGDHGVGQAGAAHHHHRIEPVRLGAQIAPLRGGQRRGGGSDGGAGRIGRGAVGAVGVVGGIHAPV